MQSTRYGDDVYTEPADVDGHTLAHLGPLARLAGRRRGTRGADVNPKAGGTTVNSIVSQPFLEDAFTTLAYRIVVTLEADGGCSDDGHTVLQIRGQAAPFHHRDRSTLARAAAPKPNLLMRGAGP